MSIFNKGSDVLSEVVHGTCHNSLFWVERVHSEGACLPWHSWQLMVDGELLLGWSRQCGQMSSLMQTV